MGWLLVAAASLAIAINQVLKLTDRFRGEPPQPANPQLGQSVNELDRRVTMLERWQREVAEKMEADKIEIMNAGEQRASRIHQHIEQDRTETTRKIDELKANVVRQFQDTERALGRIEGKLDAKG